MLGPSPANLGHPWVGPGPGRRAPLLGRTSGPTLAPFAMPTLGHDSSPEPQGGPSSHEPHQAPFLPRRPAPPAKRLPLLLQARLISNLNQLPWNKVAVQTLHYHSHAAIVIRDLRYDLPMARSFFAYLTDHALL